MLKGTSSAMVLASITLHCVAAATRYHTELARNAKFPAALKLWPVIVMRAAILHPMLVALAKNGYAIVAPDGVRPPAFIVMGVIVEPAVSEKLTCGLPLVARLLLALTVMPSAMMVER